MRALLWKILDDLQQSYWFIPMLMALGAVAMSVIMVALDRVVGSGWLHRISWLYASEPAGARALLQTIAGSMITVAGVTFSITIASLANFAAQFGPRLMTNFMNDRGNQITLGTFVATFLYCLLVLRTVRGGDDSSASFIFVPNFAILVGLLMAVASLGVLIYFIHHIPESIHLSQTIARVGKSLLARIEAIYPSRIGKDAAHADLRSSEELITPPPFEDTAMVNSNTTGFVQYINDAQLIEVAQKYDLVLWIVRRPGDFATPEQALVLVKPTGLVNDIIIRKIQAAFILGTRRTPSQDVLFLVDQLVEVAIRALSPGVNDPMTAIYCINWLSAALGELSGHALPSRYRLDSKGQIRIVATPVDYADFTDAIFGKLRPYIQCDRNAALHMLNVMSDLIAKARTETQKSLIRCHFDALRDGCASSLSHPADQAAIDQIFAGAASRYVDFKDTVPTEKTDEDK